MSLQLDHTIVGVKDVAARLDFSYQVLALLIEIRTYEDA